MFFLLFLHDDRKIRIRIQEAQKHTDLTDPDSDPNPQHWLVSRCLLLSCAMPHDVQDLESEPSESQDGRLKCYLSAASVFRGFGFF